MVRELEPKDFLKFLRVRTSTEEIMIAPETKGTSFLFSFWLFLLFLTITFFFFSIQNFCRGKVHFDRSSRTRFGCEAFVVIFL